MTQYRDYKKPWNKKFLMILAVSLFLILPLVFSHADTARELKNKIEQKNGDIEKLEEEIKQYQKQLEGLERQKDTLNTSLKQLDLTKKKLNADISITQNKIDKTSLKIEELGLEIGGKQNFIANNKEAIASGIREINEMDQSDILATILSEKNFTIVWNNAENISVIAEEMRKKIIELKEVKKELEYTKVETINARNELVSLKNKLADQKKIVEQNAKDKQKLLVQTKNNEANYQKILKEQLAKKETFEKELRDYESQLEFILDPDKLPPAGVLSWPLDDVFVTQQFGAKTGPHRTYISGHSGTDFRARTPQPVKSMADGVVKGIGNTDESCPGASFGKWIFIDYGNGLSSAFGHLSLIKVSEGEKVKRGEVVGYTGGTGRVTGPHLHVSLYASSAVKVDTVPSKTCPGKILKQPIAAISGYLDPMYYLPPYEIKEE